MSTAEIDTSRRLRFTIAAVLISLLALSWPTPVRWVSRDLLRADAGSFPGREAPELDFLYWSLLVLLLAAAGPSFAEARNAANELLSQGRNFARGKVLEQEPVRLVRGTAIAASLIVISIAVDARVIEILARADLKTSSAVRLVNRAGGGANPLLVVALVFCAAAMFRSEKLRRIVFTMIVAGATAGALAQILKSLVDRARPELWLGSAAFGDETSSSFPSGHTAGAFALAASVWLHAESRSARLFALAAASAVGLARVAAFRHWPSDVVVSAILGWFAAAGVAWRLGGDAAARSRNVRAFRPEERSPSHPKDR